MKREILIFTLILNTIAAFAQTEKGNVLIGGYVNAYGSFRGERKDISIGVSPNVGYFFARGLALGVNPSYSYSISKFRIENTGSANSEFNYKSTGIGISPFIRYYLMIGNTTSFFGYARGGYNLRKAIDESYGGVAGRQIREYTYTTPSFSAGPGFAYFLNKNIALEALFTYNAERTTGKLDNSTSVNASSNITFNIGLQVFVGRN